MTRKIILLLSLFLACSGGFVGVHASLAADWYVDKTATGANNGTSWANAWTSFSAINWAALNAAGIQTLYIAGDTYTEELQIIHNPAVKSEANRLYIRPGSASPISGRAGYDGVVNINRANGSAITLGEYGGNGPVYYVTISGERTSGSGLSNMKVYGSVHNIRSGWEPQTATYTGLKILYLKLRGDAAEDGKITNTGDGIEIPSNIYGIEIAYNTIRNEGNCGIRQPGFNGSVGYGTTGSIHHNTISIIADDTIHLSVGGWDIYNNEIRGWDSGAQHADGLAGTSQYMRVYNNVFHDNTQEIFVELYGINAAHWRIFNNVFYDSSWETGTEPAIIIYTHDNASVDDLLITNNTFAYMSQVAINFAADPGKIITLSNSLIANNLFHENYRNDYMSAGAYASSDIPFFANVFSRIEGFQAEFNGGPYGDLNDFNRLFSGVSGYIANSACIPSLINPPLWDFHPSQDDRCIISSGKDLSFYCSTVPQFCSDKDGNVHPQNSAWAIGAYEYVKGGDTTPPAAPRGLVVN